MKKTKKSRKAKKTVAGTTAANNTETSNGRGRPSGSGNYLTSVAEIVRMTGVEVSKEILAELNKHHIPVIQSVIKKANLNSKKAPFKTNKQSLNDWYARYTKSPAITSSNLSSQEK